MSRAISSSSFQLLLFVCRSFGGVENSFVTIERKNKKKFTPHAIAAGIVTPTTSVQSPVLCRMEDLNRLFLEPAALERIFIYMCRSSTRDPIAETMRTMLTTPIEFHISRYGLGLFKGCAVFPFTFMTNEQRTWLYELLSSLSGDQMHTALQRLQDPLDITTENDRIFLRERVHPHNGGHAALPSSSSSSSSSSTIPPSSSPPTTSQLRILDPKRVFNALLGAMQRSVQHASQPERMHLLANLLLQRIGCQVCIGRDTLLYIQSEMDRRFGRAPAGKEDQSNTADSFSQIQSSSS